MEIYVDDQGQLVKEHVKAGMTITIPDFQMKSKINATGDIEFSNIGKDVVITAPKN